MNTYIDTYANVPEPSANTRYALVDPSSPVRTEKTIEEVNTRDDGAALATQIFFGTPVFLESHAFCNYASIRLSTHGSDPLPGADYVFGIETHKLRVPISVDEAIYLGTSPAWIVTNREGVNVVESSCGTTHNLHFGSRLPEIANDGTFVIGSSGANPREYRLLSDRSGLSPCSADGATVEELVRRVAVFQGANFMWGMASPDYSDASGWISNIFHTFGVPLPHSTKRIEAALRNRHETKDLGSEIENLKDLKTGDLIFLGAPNKGISYMGMALRGEDNSLLIRHCLGKGAMQNGFPAVIASGNMDTARIVSETQILGIQNREIKAAWRVLDFV